MTDDLPASWLQVRLGEVCEPVTQRGPSAERKAFRYIDLGAIDNKNKRVSATELVPTSKAPSRAKQNVRAGDVVFSTVRVYLENIAEVTEDLDGEVASTAFCVLRPARGIASRYVYHYVTSRPFVLAVNKLQRGNSPPSVQDGDIRTQPLPLAPEQEQQRIASKIDELFSRIEEGERALERVQKLVERYRQSVLKAAVTGELTRDWLEKNKGTLESGEALLARILKARREAWEKAELDKIKAKGIMPTNDKWKQKYEEPSAPRLGLAEELPLSWTQLSLEQATRGERPIAYGVLQPGEDLSAGVLMVRVCDVADGVIETANLKKIAPAIAGEFPRTRLRGGEVLLTLVGTIGRTGIVPTELAGANVARAVGVLAPTARVLVDWLELCLRHEKTRQVLTENAREVARKTLNLEQLREYAIPCPSEAEQREAISRMSELFSKADAAAGAIERQTRYARALRQSILRSAFSGKLVAHNEADEPAAALLQRIAAERDAAPAKPKRGPKNKAKSPA